MNNALNRRKFITQAALAPLTAISISQIVSAAVVNTSAKKVILNANDIILFQGDSITE